MQSFRKLFRQMRASTPLATIAEYTGLSPDYLLRIEEGRLVVDAETASNLLLKGFGLTEAEVHRLILGVQLYDLGLRNADMRKIVTDLIRKEAPAGAAGALRETYRRLTTRLS